MIARARRSRSWRSGSATEVWCRTCSCFIGLLHLIILLEEPENGETELALHLPLQLLHLRLDDQVDRFMGCDCHIETYHDRLKNIFELERFSGSSVHAIEQDFYGVLFLATLESILSKPAQAQLRAQGQARGCTNPLKVNRAVSYVTVLDHVVELLCDPRSTAGETLAAIEHLLQTTPTRHRTGRHFARKKRSAAHRLRFAKYGKRVLA
jgi:hypothetical protein